MLLHKRGLWRLGLSLPLFLLTVYSQADTPPSVPLFEAGVFAGEGYTPDYPGSAQNHPHFIVLPFAIYRGTVIRVDERDGVRVTWKIRQRIRLEGSVAGSFRTGSGDGDARQGMPDLDWMGEIGPRLTIFLTDPAQETRLKFWIPVRAVFSTDGTNFRHRGFTATPGLVLEKFNFIKPRWRGIALLSATFADRELNAYFYDVAPQFSRPDRPFYDARAGYLGSDFILGLVIPANGRFRFFGGVQMDWRDGAANTASPLLKSHYNAGVFVGVAFSAYRTARTELN